MGKLNEYEPIERYQNFTNPTTKPFKSGAVGFQEKKYTLQEQIYHRLKKAAKLIEVLFATATHHHSPETSSKIRQNLGKLNNDIFLIQNSLVNEPFDFSTSHLEINQEWIDDMKGIVNNLRLSMSDTNDSNEIRNVGRLNHILTELDHLMHPRPGFKEVKDTDFFKVGLNDNKYDLDVEQKLNKKEFSQTKTQLKKGSKMMNEENFLSSLTTANAAVKKPASKKKSTASKRSTKSSTAKKSTAAKRTTKKSTAKKTTSKSKSAASKTRTGTKAKKAAPKRSASTKKTTARSTKSKSAGTRKTATKRTSTAKRRTVKASPAAKRVTARRKTTRAR